MDQQSQNKLFINFSNHPSSNWSEIQINASKELCNNGDIIDIPFPAVSADADEAEIKKIAKEYAKEISSMAPAVVMCMGEFGVCHRVVELLKANEIVVVYSCSKRIAKEINTENGIEKTSVFSFVKFRKY